MDKLVLCVIAIAAMAARVEAKPDQIVAIRALPYFHDDGRIGDTDMTQNSPGMNIADGGDADGPPTRITIVQVELATDEAGDPGETLEVVVKAGKKQKLSQKLDVVRFDRKKHAPKLPFVVYDTGCDALSITATLRAKKQKPVVKTATVQFMCGE
jgi:hypothetical protein